MPPLRTGSGGHQCKFGRTTTLIDYHPMLLSSLLFYLSNSPCCYCFGAILIDAAQPLLLMSLLLIFFDFWVTIDFYLSNTNPLSVDFLLLQSGRPLVEGCPHHLLVNVINSIHNGTSIRSYTWTTMLCYSSSPSVHLRVPLCSTTTEEEVAGAASRAASPKQIHEGLWSNSWAVEYTVDPIRRGWWWRHLLLTGGGGLWCWQAGSVDGYSGSRLICQWGKIDTPSRMGPRRHERGQLWCAEVVY